MATETLVPTGAGDSTQLVPIGETANWQCTDDDNADTSYVRSSTTDTNTYIDLYDIDTTTIPAGSTINSVTFYIKCKSGSNTYVADFYIKFKDTVNAYVGTIGNFQPGTTYTLYNSVVNTNPATSAAWTLAEVNALQIGVSIASGIRESTQVIYAGRCTYCYCVIDYTEGAAGVQRFTLINLEDY